MATPSRTDSDPSTHPLYRRTLLVLMTSQVFGGAGLGAGVTVGALLVADMLGSTGLSGLAAALFTVGSAAGAWGVGRLSQRSGRRVGLTAGYLAGAGGGGAVVLAAAVDSIPLLFLALLVYGAGTATNLQARYAGTDLVGADRRGRAISSVLVATTLGAVAGPNLVGITGEWAGSVGIPALAGPFALAAAAYGIGAAVLHLFLRPDPLLVARAEAGLASTVAAASPSPAGHRGGLLIGATAMVLTQVVMVAVMTMTPIHMKSHGHGLGATGLVIAIHIAAMYLPSPITGILVDRVGRIPVVVAAGVTLLAAGVVAATASADSVVALAVALALLGLGWNLGLIGGTAITADSLPLATQARTQGALDISVALAGAGGGMASGLVVTTAGYQGLALSGGVLAMMIVPVVLWSGRRPRP